MAQEEVISIQKEIEILSKVDHPNIVRIIETFEEDDYWCIVMELMTGGDLFDKIIDTFVFTEDEVREAIRVIIDSVGYLHFQGIIHRDIKPENLMLSSKDLGISKLKISDFGLARFLDTESLATTICGTPGYVAPEVLEQKPYGKECDFWAIGIITFIL